MVAAYIGQRRRRTNAISHRRHLIRQKRWLDDFRLPGAASRASPA